MEAPVKGDFRLARRTTTVAGVEIPAGVDPDGAQRSRQPRPPPLRVTRRSSGSTATTRASTSPSGAACTAAPVGRWPAWRRG